MAETHPQQTIYAKTDCQTHEIDRLCSRTKTDRVRIHDMKMKRGTTDTGRHDRHRQRDRDQRVF